MKVSVIGTGYVGLVSGTCFAEIGHDVTCIDIVPEKIDMLKEGKSPIYEPGLSELLERNIKQGRLHFSTGYESISDVQVIFLAVGTPSGDDGRADLSYLREAAKSVAKELSEGAVVVIKSTVPVGTSVEIRELISNNTDKEFSLVNNPEFLKEGSAVDDFMRPDRVIIGYREDAAAEVMDELYKPLLRQGNPLYKMSNLSAEMSKYAANCFLASKISFINEIARLCDLSGADIEEVRRGISSDQRIGGHFLYPGPGYGGSCFPKDVKALMHTAQEKGMTLEIVEATERVNEAQKKRLMDKIRTQYPDGVNGKTFAFWGVAFKANTDDVRETAAIALAKELVASGAKIHYYDPIASANYHSYMEKTYPNVASSLQGFEDKYECVKGTDGLITMTEWREFQNPDFSKIKDLLTTAVIFDGRNLYETQKILEAGFKYYAIGKYIPGGES